jgi:hypothetical protein
MVSSMCPLHCQLHIQSHPVKTTIRIVGSLVDYNSKQRELCRDQDLKRVLQRSPQFCYVVGIGTKLHYQLL